MYMLILFYIFFFFFQAEDGIRDIGVTGVQTCALPISRAASTRASSSSLQSGRPRRCSARTPRTVSKTPMGAPTIPPLQIGRASCRERGVDLGGRRRMKKKKTERET